MSIVPPYLNASEQAVAQNLLTALETNDTASITHTLETWPSQPTLKPASADTPELWPFKLVLSGAIDQEHTQLVSYVLSQDIKVEMYAILRALDLQSQPIFQTFVDHGWDINEPLGATQPPALAYVLKNRTLTTWFLAHGACPNTPSSRLYRTPIMFAAEYASLDIIKLLYVHGANLLSVLQTAAESAAEGRLEVMEFLLDQGAAIDAVKWQHHEYSYSSFGGLELGTALHYAAKNGYVERVEMLLERGARVGVRDSMGRTAVEEARERGEEGVARVLEGWVEGGGREE